MWTWPIGMGVDFRGLYDIRGKRLMMPREVRTDPCGRTVPLHDTGAIVDLPEVEGRIAEPALEELALCVDGPAEVRPASRSWKAICRR